MSNRGAMMKVLHLNASDSFGGAAKACFRLHEGLRANGVDSNLLVQTKSNNHENVHGPGTNFRKIYSLFQPYLDRLPLGWYGKSVKTQFHVGWLPDGLKNRINALNPDVLHLHWVCDGFLNINTLRKIDVPIVWTLHDMWPYTGGCHHSGDCDAYTSACGKCPQLDSASKHDLSWWVWQKKSSIVGEKISAIVSPSTWMGNCAKESSIFRQLPVHTVPNGLDLSLFKPIDKKVARRILNLPEHQKLILFGSIRSLQNKRKGIDHLLDALGKIEKKHSGTGRGLILFGDSGRQDFSDIRLPVFSFGYLSDDISLVLLYSAADVFVLPTMEDNLPNTIMEALACGTPCISFDVGGVSDMISHGQNGYLAKPFDIDDLANVIDSILSDEHRNAQMSANAAAIANEKYDIRKIAAMHEELYASII